jgi:hypothetical protein
MVYDVRTGAVISERGSMPPADMPQLDANRPTGTFKDQWYGAWNPSDSTDDPHDVPYQKA